MISVKSKLLLIFFFSGFSSLVYQIVWQKSLSQLIGLDHISVTLIVSLFMLGLGMGGAAGGKLTTKPINLFKAYFLIELLLAIFGIFSLDLLQISNEYFSDFQQSYLLDYAVNFAVLFTPTFLMGLSLPIISHVFADETHVGELIGKIYTANILGAASGALITGFVLIGLFGMQASVYIAAFINFALGITMLKFYKASENSIDLTPSVHTDQSNSSVLNNPLYYLSFCIGFIALAYEIILFRVFTSYFGATVYVFTILIFSYLVMMALGNRYFGKLSDKWSFRLIGLLLTSMTIISSLVILYGQDVIYLLGLRQNYLILWSFRTWLLFAQIVPIILISMLLMAPVAFLSGFFPAIIAKVNEEKKHIGGSVGTIYGIQTLGNFAGAFITGFVLLPLMGTIGSLTFLCTVLIFIAFCLYLPNLRDLITLKRGALLSTAALAILIFPDNFYSSVRLFSEATPKDSPRPTVVREGEFGATLGYLAKDSRMHVYVGRMFSNSFETQSPPVAHEDGCFPLDWSSQLKHGKVKRALYIGVGTGLGPTCILNLFPEVELDIVEINPDLIGLMEDYASDEVLQVFDASTVFINDGRRFLANQPDGFYDLIQVGVFNGWCSGCGNLFTEDFFAVVNRKLAQNGYVTLNAYPAALKAAINSFEYVNVYSPGSSRISDVVASGTNNLTIDNGGQILIRDGMTRRFVDEGCTFDKAQLKKPLEKIRSSTDDLPTTEYFMTQRQFIYDVDFLAFKPATDMRIFDCVDL